MSQHQLVVGAGPVGTATATMLADQGEQVVLMSRSGGGPSHPGVRLVAGDAADAGGLAQAAKGATAVYNCLNPAYDRWPVDWPPMAAALLNAAERSGAVLATVGNLYPYGRVSGRITTDLPFDAPGRKARVRAAMWREALAAHEAGRIRMTEVRGSDYLTTGRNSHLGDLAAGRLVQRKAAMFVVPVDQLHTFTYVPDVAATVVAAAANPHAWGRAWHVPSAPPVTARQAVADLCAAAGVPRVPVRVVPWPVVRAVGVAVPFMRELGEMRHSWQSPYVLDASATTTELGVEATAWSNSTAAVVEWYRTRRAA